MFRNNLILFLRVLRRHLGFYLTSMVGLSVGMASFLCIVAYVNYEMSFDDFHAKGESIYRVVSNSSRTPVPLATAVRNELPGVVNSTRVIFSTSGSKTLVKNSKGELFEEDAYFVDSTFFDIFSFSFVGQTPKDIFHSSNEIVLTKTLADRYFPGREAVGQTVELVNDSYSNHDFKVIGIVDDIPSNSQFKAGLFLPFSTYGSATYTIWSINLVYTYIQIDPNASPVTLNDQMRAIVRRETNLSGTDLNEWALQPFQQLHFNNSRRSDFGPHNRIENIYILLSIGILILVIAGINFVSLSTAKATERMKEVGLRKTLGAARSSLLIQFTFESVMLSLLAAVLGIVLLILFSPVFEDFGGVRLWPALQKLGNYIVPLMLLPVLLGILAGLYPAYVIARVKPTDSLKQNPSSLSGHSFRTSLATVQFSITILMIASTLIVGNQLHYIRSKDLGFDQNFLLALNVGGPGIGENLHTIRHELLNNKNVINVSGALTLPGGHTYMAPYSSRETMEKENDEVEIHFKSLFVDHEFVDNMKLDVVQGRAFLKESSADTLSFIVNESAVKTLMATYGPDWKDPVGRTLNYFRSNTEGWYPAKKGIIIGVVRDFNFASLHYGIEPLIIQVDYRLLYKILVRIRPEEMPVTIEFIKNTWNRSKIERPFNYEFLDQQLESNYAREQQFNLMFRVFSVISILISCLGLYGLALYSTQRRSKEISIRKVVGASDADLFILLVKYFLLPVLIAFVLVCPLGYYLMDNWLQQFAFHISLGPGIFIVAGGICFLIALMAVLRSLLRAIGSNPVRYLKEN